MLRRLVFWGALALLYGVAFALCGTAGRVVASCAAVLFTLWATNTARQDRINAFVDEFNRAGKRSATTERFSEKKVPADLDAIVIGSGSSGMTCAAVLARAGKRVLVLEQHYVIGGGAHMFDLQGYYFDSGLHYVVPWSEQLLQLVCGGKESPVKFDLLGESDGTFDKVVLGDLPEFRIKHKEAHIKDLYALFPENKKDIDEYMKISWTAMNTMPFYALSRLVPQWLQGVYEAVFLRTFRKFAGKTTLDVLNSITSNKHLASLLNGLWIDTGGLPEKSTFMLSACVFRGLPLEGGTYPRGGSQNISKSMVPIIESAGGKVLCRVPVEEILIDENTLMATGVRVGGPKPMTIRAKMVISSCGYPNTFSKLVKESVTKKAGIPREIGVEASPGFLMCNIGIRGKASELGVTCANIWYHPVAEGVDMFKSINDFWSDPLDSDVPMMITFPSMKDRSWEDEHPDKITCQILVVTDYAWFEKWRAQLSGKRDEEYAKLKKAWETKCLEKLYRFFPKVRGKVEVCDVSTPLSIEYYLEEPRGGAVGLAPSPERYSDPRIMRQLDIVTPVKNLYMTGQDTFLCGQPCVQIAGLLSGLRILGLGEGLTFLGDCVRNGLRSAELI